MTTTELQQRRAGLQQIAAGLSPTLKVATSFGLPSGFSEKQEVHLLSCSSRSSRPSADSSKPAPKLPVCKGIRLASPSYQQAAGGRHLVLQTREYPSMHASSGKGPWLLASSRRDRMGYIQTDRQASIQYASQSVGRSFNQTNKTRQSGWHAGRRHASRQTCRQAGRQARN